MFQEPSANYLTLTALFQNQGCLLGVESSYVQKTLRQLSNPYRIILKSGLGVRSSY